MEAQLASRPRASFLGGLEFKVQQGWTFGAQGYRYSGMTVSLQYSLVLAPGVARYACDKLLPGILQAFLFAKSSRIRATLYKDWA